MSCLKLIDSRREKLLVSRVKATRNQRKNRRTPVVVDCAQKPRNTGAINRKHITELLFENCLDCVKMAAIPMAAFAVNKVRSNQERMLLNPTMMQKESKMKGDMNGKAFDKNLELTPLKYNSKLMNSIWGLYNRYSVHNFKKNTDPEEGVVAAVWDVILKNHAPTATTLVHAAANSSSGV